MKKVQPNKTIETNKNEHDFAFPEFEAIERKLKPLAHLEPFLVDEALSFSVASTRTARPISPSGWRVYRALDPERPFTFEHDEVVLRVASTSSGGRVNTRSSSTTSRTPSRDVTPREIVEAEYVLQRLVYALVCLRGGASEVEVAYQFLERPDDVVSTKFTRDDVPALEAELSAAIARIRAGDFRPTPSEFVCSDCPALDLVAPGPASPTQ